MSPIIATRASDSAQAFGFLGATGTPFALAGNYESIASFIVPSAGTSSVTFANIPQTYSHLQIRALTVSTSASSGAAMTFNFDSGANYKGHSLYGTGATPGATATSSIYAPQFNGGGATASPGSAIIDILDYANINKYTTVRSLDGYDANGSGYVGLSSGLWLNTNAVTSITMSLSNYSQYSSFALYGVKI